MNLARISKKQPHADSRQTLDALHQDKIKEFQDQYDMLPELEKKLENLIYMYESENYKGDIFKLYDEIVKLQKHVKKIKNGEYESEYLFKAAPYLMEYGESCKITKEIEVCDIDYEAEDDESDYEADDDVYNKYKNISGFVNEQQLSNKGELCKNFITECIKGCPINKENMYEERLICECGGYREVNTKEAMAVCIECGNVINYQDAHTHPQYSDEIEILSQFALIFLARKSILLDIFSHYIKINSCDTEIDYYNNLLYPNASILNIIF